MLDAFVLVLLVCLRIRVLIRIKRQDLWGSSALPTLAAPVFFLAVIASFIPSVKSPALQLPAMPLAAIPSGQPEHRPDNCPTYFVNDPQKTWCRLQDSNLAFIHQTSMDKNPVACIPCPFYCP